MASLMQSLLINIHFHNDHVHLGGYTDAQLQRPNLGMEFVATPDGTPNSYLGLELDGSPVLGFTKTVTYASWVSDGTILSVKDLLRAQAVVEPIFGAVSGTDSRALEVWQGVTISRLKMSTGDGRWFEFHKGSPPSIGKIPVFVGSFR